MNGDRLFLPSSLNFDKNVFSDYYSLSYLKVASDIKKLGVKVREFEGLEFVAG